MAAQTLTDIDRLRSSRLFRQLAGDSQSLSKSHLEDFLISHPSASSHFGPLLSLLEQTPDLTCDAFIKFLSGLPPAALAEALSLSLGGGRTFVSASSATGHHSYEESEKSAIAKFVESLLGDDPNVAARFPITDLFEAVRDGVLLCHLVNKIKPGTIPKGRFNERPNNNIVQMTENCGIALESAKSSLGCRFQNIGAVDIVQGNGMLILAALWQLIKLELGAKFSLDAAAAAAGGQPSTPRSNSSSSGGAKNASDDQNSPEALLIRWVNEKLILSNSPKLLSNLSSDLKDCKIFIYLLNHLAPSECPLELLQTTDVQERVDRFLDSIRSLNFGNFVSSTSIIKGNSRMNFAFLASLYSHFSKSPAKPPEKSNDASTAAAAAAATPSDAAPATASSDEALQRARAEFEQEKVALMGQLQRAMQLVQQQAEQARLLDAELETTKTDLLACLQQLEEQDGDISDLRKLVITQDEESQALMTAIDELKLEVEDARTNLASRTQQCEDLEAQCVALKQQPPTATASSTTVVDVQAVAEPAAAAAASSSSSSSAAAAEATTSSGDATATSSAVVSFTSSDDAKLQKRKTRADQLRSDMLEMAHENQRLIERLQFLQSRFEDDLALARAVFQELGAEAIAALSPQRCGMLTKQGGSVKSWKRRYFMLKDNFLLYYKSSRDPKPLGVIHLDEFQVEIAKPEEVLNPTKGLPKHCFKIVCAGRTYFICSERQIDMDLWIEQIKSAPRWYQTDDSRFRIKPTRAFATPSIYDDY